MVAGSALGSSVSCSTYFIAAIHISSLSSLSELAVPSDLVSLYSYLVTVLVSFLHYHTVVPETLYFLDAVRNIASVTYLA
jgi:hypothetical protein